MSEIRRTPISTSLQEGSGSKSKLTVVPFLMANCLTCGAYFHYLTMVLTAHKNYLNSIIMMEKEYKFRAADILHSHFFKVEKRMPALLKTIKRAYNFATDWEQWHHHLKYIPLYPVWLWYCVKSRSLWFFTPSNPTLTFGGFEGEGKKEMYKQLPFSCYPNTLYIAPSQSFTEVEKLVMDNRISYPLAVKPEIGMMGLLFRKINNAEDLQYYHSRMPVDYLIQELVDYPMEVSVFYYRFPHLDKGVITGFLKKELLEVEGDGRSTLRALLNQFESRPGFKIKEYLRKHAARLDDVIPNGEVYRLSWVANLSRGGMLVSLAHEIDDRLLNIFDQLSHHAGHFYYGRYDIKCASIESLKKGEAFSILEYNGSGAEPHHIYHNGNSLLQAYRIVVGHWKVLYKISKINHRRGFRYWKFLDGLNFISQATKHFRMLKQLDMEMP